MFLQVHFLTSYHATLLNRDDAGLAKRIAFGGSPRLRVSSQCQKRHWREWMFSQTSLPTGVRSRHFFDRVVKRELVDGGMDAAYAHELVFHLGNAVLHSASSKEGLTKDTLAMSQPVLFGRPEAEYFVSVIREAARRGDASAAKSYIDDTVTEAKRNFKAMLRQSGTNEPAVGFEGAMFGRFVTSDILSRVDAPVHVAHAFTTHALDTEVDFFTVVDDLAEVEETGAAHANDMELGAGLFYGYVAVDVPLLVSNLSGCDPKEWRDGDVESARRLLELLVTAAAEVSPGAKLGATAPYARAECVLLEVGDEQPRSLANAFLKAIPLRHGGDAMRESVEAMSNYVEALDRMYGAGAVTRFVATLHPWPAGLGTSATFQASVTQALDALFGAPR